MLVLQAIKLWGPWVFLSETAWTERPWQINSDIPCITIFSLQRGAHQMWVFCHSGQAAGSQRREHWRRGWNSIGLQCRDRLGRKIPWQLGAFLPWICCAWRVPDSSGTSWPKALESQTQNLLEVISIGNTAERTFPSPRSPPRA